MLKAGNFSIDCSEGDYWIAQGSKSDTNPIRSEKMVHCREIFCPKHFFCNLPIYFLSVKFSDFFEELPNLYLERFRKPLWKSEKSLCFILGFPNLRLSLVLIYLVNLRVSQFQPFFSSVKKSIIFRN